MFDHLLESSHRDDSNKWSNIGFGEDTGILENKKRTLYAALNLHFASVRLLNLSPGQCNRSYPRDKKM